MEYQDNPGANRMSDQEIIELYWKRNEQAIRETDNKYGHYLYVISYNILHDRLDCEECINDTYLGTWNRIPPTRPKAFLVFLSKITRNISVDRFRKNTAARRIPSEMMISLEELDESFAVAPSAADDYMVSQIAEILNSYLRELNSKKEFVFVCRYYYADRISTIAQMLGISENTVLRYLSEVRRGLKARLEKGGISIE